MAGPGRAQPVVKKERLGLARPARASRAKQIERSHCHAVLVTLIPVHRNAAG